MTTRFRPGDDLAGMGAVIDRIVEPPEVVRTDSKVVRWIEGESKADPTRGACLPPWSNILRLSGQLLAAG